MPPRAKNRRDSSHHSTKVKRSRRTSAPGAKAQLDDCPKCGTPMVVHVSCPRCNYSPDTAYSSLHEAKEFTHPG